MTVAGQPLRAGRQPPGEERSPPASGRGAAWARGAVIYQVFADRFARSDGRETARGRRGWMGGDLAGIARRLGYLEELGIDLLYLTPIFAAASYHRYDVCDFYRVDPRLGSLGDFQRLLDGAHRRRIRVLLDGVFNHCGRGFEPFRDLEGQGPRSPYRHWFRLEPRTAKAGQLRFKTWRDAPHMPLLNLGHREVREYLLRVAAFWTRQGIDGWRLDAVPHVNHRAFWTELRRAVRRINPRAYLLAEIWGDARPWLAARQFDGATNYRFREIVLRFVARRTIRARAFAARLQELLASYPWEANLGMCNLLGSHDTARLWTVAGGDAARVKLAFLLLFAFPGIPAVYYGDEIGLEGGEDPDNRRAMPWDPAGWRLDLRGHVQRLIAARRTEATLRDGDWRLVEACDRRNLCVFTRRSAAGCVLVLLNNGERRAAVDLDLDRLGCEAAGGFVDLLDGTEYLTRAGRLLLPDLPPVSGMLLAPRPARAGPGALALKSRPWRSPDL